MKRWTIPVAAVLSLLLSGCGTGRGIYSNYRAIEELQIVQTLGADSAGGRLVLSAAAGRPRSGAAPLILRRAARGIPQGMDALQERTPRGQLYFAHTQYLVLGQAYAGGGLEEILDFVERDIHTRMGALLFVVRGGTAEALITGSGEEWDVSDVLSTVKAETDRRGSVSVFDVRETAVALSEYGAALICALKSVETEGSVFSVPAGRAAVPDGYGILKSGALVGFLDGGQAEAASLLLGRMGTVTREVSVGGGTVTAEISCGSPEITLDRSAAGAPLLIVRAAPTAVIAASDLPLAEIGDAALTAALNETLQADLLRVLVRSQEENADFLALGRALRMQGVDPASLPPDWLTSLLLQVRVETLVRHSYDLGPQVGTDGGCAA